MLNSANDSPVQRVMNSDEPENPLGLERGELAVLRAVAAYPSCDHATLLPLVTGLKARSIQSHLSSLSSRGLVTRARGTAVCTEMGLKGASPIPPRKTGLELLKFSLRTLPQGEANVLREVLDVWPNAIQNKLISERTGLSLRSVQNYLSRLSTMRLVTRHAGRASIRLEVVL